MGGSSTQTSNQTTASSESQSGRSTTSIDPSFQTIQLQNLDRARGVANQLGAPYAGELSSSFDNTVLPGAIGTYQAQAGYRPPSLSNVNYDSYTSPFVSGVIDLTMGDIERQKRIGDVEAQSQATKAGAFGGSRSAVLQSLNDESWNRNMAAIVAQLRQQGFSQAQEAAAKDAANDIAAANLRNSAAAGLASIAGMQNQNTVANLERAYNAWQARNQGLLSGQTLANQTIYGLAAPTTTETSGQSQSSGTASGRVQTSHDPSFLEIVQGLESLARGIGSMRTGGSGRLG